MNFYRSKNLSFTRIVLSRPLVRIIFFSALLNGFGAAVSHTVFAQNESEKSEAAKKDDDKILVEIRTAKNFVENEDWEKARAKFAEIISDFPQNRYLDIAYYWLAYSLFQERKFPEAEQTLAELRTNFPDSAWLDEAKTLQVEINSKSGRQTAIGAEEFSASDDETKAFALQNLLKTDRQTAVRQINEILGGAGDAADNLKESVLILLADDKSDWAAEKFFQVLKTEKNENVLKQALIGLRSRDKTKVLPVVRDFLRRNENENLIDAALYALAGDGGETALATLVNLAQNGESDELKQKSIIWIGEKKSEKAIEELKKLYYVYSSAELKKQVQISLVEMEMTEAYQAVIGLLEGETNRELVEHGLDLLKEKNDPVILRFLEKKPRDER